MAAYSIDVLIRKWSREELTLEQAMGQILQIIQKLDQRLRTLEGRKVQPHPGPAETPEVRPEEGDQGAGEAISPEERDMANGDAE